VPNPAGALRLNVFPAQTGPLLEAAVGQEQVLIVSTALALLETGQNVFVSGGICCISYSRSVVKGCSNS